MTNTTPTAQECKCCLRHNDKGGQCKGKKNICMPCLAFTTSGKTK